MLYGYMNSNLDHGLICMYLQLVELMYKFPSYLAPNILLKYLPSSITSVFLSTEPASDSGLPKTCIKSSVHARSVRSCRFRPWKTSLARPLVSRSSREMLASTTEPRFTRRKIFV